jgi:hypothetical protein
MIVLPFCTEKSDNFQNSLSFFYKMKATISITLLQREVRQFPMTEKTLKVRKQVTAVKYRSEMKKSSSDIFTSETIKYTDILTS